MTNTIENYYSLLEAKRKDISDSDFRFYNLSHLPLLVSKTNELSTTCTQCKKHIQELELLLEMLPECLNKPAERKKFDSMKNRIEKHLRKVHNVHLANYYYAWYTALGGILGAILGLFISILNYNKIELEAVGIACIVGVLLGQLAGKSRDSKSRSQKTMI